MCNYVECYTCSNENGETDLDFLWGVAGELAVALGTTLERLAEIDPTIGRELSQTLSDSDAWAIERAKEQPDALAHVVTTVLSARRLASLPQDAIRELLESDDRDIRLTAIAAVGAREKSSRRRETER